MGPVRQNPIQRTLSSVHVCSSLCTIVAHNTAQNRPDNFPCCPPDNHHCSNDVYLRGRGFLMTQEMTGWHWHQLDHMQIICTSLQTDNHASTASVSFYIYIFIHQTGSKNNKTNKYRLDALPDVQPTLSKYWMHTYTSVHTTTMYT